MVLVFSLGRSVFFVVSGTSSSVDGVVVGSAGHEIDLAGSEGLDGTKVDIISLKWIASSSPSLTM